MANVSPCKLPIDWKLLAQAEEFYRSRLGSTYLETSWIVDPEVAGITAPSDEIKCSRGQLVGSAEQGFLQMLSDEDPRIEIDKGKYYHSISPCFRDDVVDELHMTHFMKLELIYPLPKGGYTGMYSVLEEMMKCAGRFFIEVGEITCNVEMTSFNNHAYTGDSYDIIGLKSGIELGSYGIRKHGNIRWVYGTGLALPRFSQVKEAENKYENNI